MTDAEFKQARSDLSLTQSALAERLGISKRQVIRYEQGSRPIPLLVQFSMSLFLLDLQKVG